MRTSCVTVSRSALLAIIILSSFTFVGCGGDDDPKAQNPLAGGANTNPFVGKFNGETLSAEFNIDPDDESLRGTITHKGANYPATARRADDQITGTFVTQGKELAFTATLEDNMLSLESGGVTHVMSRQVETPPVNPLASGKDTKPSTGTNPLASGNSTKDANTTTKTPPAPKPLANGVAVTRLETETFKHPAGFTFEHPKGWQVQAGQEGIVILPGDVKKDAQGQPLEMLMIGGEDATGITDIGDQRIIQYVDQIITKMFPAFKRVGEVEKLQSLLGAGIVLNYEGKTPTNVDGKAVVHATLYRGGGIFLTHLGEKTLIDQRQGEARRIFSSFGWTKGQTDNALAGTWRRSESESSSIDARGYVGGTTTKTWVFGSDGTVAYGVGTAIYGHSTGSGVQVTIDPQKSQNVSKGAWSVNQNVLTVLWEEGGSSTYEYKVFAHVQNQTGLKLVVPGQKKPLYFIKQ